MIWIIPEKLRTELAGLNLQTKLYSGTIYVKNEIYSVDTYLASVINSACARLRLKRCNDQNPNQSVAKRTETILLLAGQRDGRKSHDTLAFEKRQSAGDHFQHPGKDLPDA